MICSGHKGGLLLFLSLFILLFICSDVLINVGLYSCVQMLCLRSWLGSVYLLFFFLCVTIDFFVRLSPGLTFTWWGCHGLCLRHKLTELAHSFLFCFCVCFYLYGPFNFISFLEFSRQLCVFSLSSFGLISALLVLSTVYLSVKISFSPDIIHSGCLGSKHQLTN